MSLHTVRFSRASPCCSARTAGPTAATGATTPPPWPPCARTVPAEAPAGWEPSSPPWPTATAVPSPTSGGSGSPAFATWSCGPLVRLYLDVGLCFEAHQQNTLVELEDGWPAVGVYRDSQGYFHREAAHDDVCAVVPHLGEASESIFPEALADERLVYYLFLNMTLGVVNALGTAGCADEAVLLADLRRLLEDERAAGGRYPATLLDRLLDDERWPCKANLATRLHDLDELVGDIATQSVYVTVPNPLMGLNPPVGPTPPVKQ